MIKTKKIISIINSLLFLFIAKTSKAQQHLINIGDGKYRKGNYELNDFLVLVITASNLILRFVGSLALLFFIYGGLMFLLSSGNKEQVSKAKGIIKAATIGLIIVFASFIIISFVLKALGIEENWGGGLISL
jgi:hypothetical protein